MRLYILLSILSLSRAARPDYLKTENGQNGCSIGENDHCVDELFTPYFHQADTDCDCIPDWCDVDPDNSNYGSLSQCQQGLGCIDTTACNYNGNATDDDGSCTYASSGYDCAGNCLADEDEDGVCNEFEVAGCTDDSACNYNGNATDDDGTCTYASSGYDCAGACLNDEDEDGVCNEFEVAGCTDDSAFNYNGNATDDDGTCVAVVLGCTDDTALNYNATANTDDGSCVAVVLGCTDDSACNFNGNATDDDNTCAYANDGYDCAGVCLVDTDGDSVCDADEVAGCTDDSAFNYNATATDDDGSCVPVVLGCTDDTALNYNADANTDDGSCVAVVIGCMNATAFNYNADANTEDDTIPCIYLKTCTAVDEIFVSGACAQLSQYAISCGLAGGKSNLCSKNDKYNGDTASCGATLENKTNLKQTCASACCQTTCADVSCPAKFNKKSPGTAGNTPEECCRETCGARHSYEDCTFEDYVYLGDSAECPSYECQSGYCCYYVEPPSSDCDCHPAEATVLVQYACDTGLCVSPRRFDKLKVGDVVQTAENTFEPVLALTHQDHDASLVYDAFYTNASATPLYISDGHYLYANGGLVLAKNARVGDVLRFDAGSFAIERKERVQKDGIFHVTTWSGTLMVDGYKTSVYTNMADVRVQEYLTTPLFWSAYKLGLPTSFSNDCNKRVTRAIAYLSPMATFVVTYTPIWTWPVSFAAYLGLLAVLSYPVQTTLAGLFAYKITKHKVKRI